MVTMETETETETKEYFVYLLESTNHRTYVGATVDVDRRLRQHNKELAGGARATGMQVERGESWHRVTYVSGFPTWQAALQFEWRWKQLSRAKDLVSCKPLEKRKKALERLLALDRSTTQAIPYAEWPQPPQLHPPVVN